MSTPAARLLDSPTVDRPLSETSSAAAQPVAPLRRLRARLQDASHIAIVVVYAVAAMMPQVRRALSTLDRV
jgi:hypothetical protein